MPRRRDPFAAWGKAIQGLVDSGQTFNANRPGNVAVQNAPQPTWPDPGTYDPTYDINADNARQGAFYRTQDFTRDWGELGAGATGGRNATDLATALARNAQQQQFSTEDVTTSRDRSLADLLQARTRGTEDYKTSIADLLHNYGRLSMNQAAQRRAAGSESGAAQASLAARIRNQTHDRAPIDTGFKRFAADNQTAQNRTREDAATSLARINAGAGQQASDLNLTYGRGREDALTGFGRDYTDLQNYLGQQGALAYYNAGTTQAPGVTLAELLRRQRNGQP